MPGGSWMGCPAMVCALARAPLPCTCVGVGVGVSMQEHAHGHATSAAGTCLDLFPGDYLCTISTISGKWARGRRFREFSLA